MRVSLTVKSGLRIAMRLVACALPVAAAAQEEGGLYIAGSEHSFEQAVDRALSQNPKGQRFFVLALPPNTKVLLRSAPKPAAALRKRVTTGNGVLLVCQRDIDSGAIDESKLAPGVVAVRGFPQPGSNAIPPGERYFPDENRANLPQANEALRRLRSTCS